MIPLRRVSEILLVIIVLASSGVQAWSNGGYSADQNSPDYGTHDWIADEAVSMQTRDVAFLKTTYHSKFLLGTEAPDNPSYIGDISKHHVYFTADQQLEDDACAVRASEMYEVALSYIRAGTYDIAAYDIGVMAHYIADPGAFGHTMGAYTDWGSEVHHGDYEDELESHIVSLPSPSGAALGDSDAYDATVNLARTITFGSGSIKPNAWMDANYNWADSTFFASAMASLNSSVFAVAAAINHLMIEAGASVTPPASPPQAPVSLSAVAERPDVLLTWSPPSDDEGARITGYLIYRGTSSDSPAYLTTVQGDVHSWTDESALRGRTYYYWVVAENSAGRSDMSDPVMVSVPRGPDSLALTALISAISVALASGTVLLWRRAREKSQP